MTSPITINLTWRQAAALAWALGRAPVRVNGRWSVGGIS